MGHQCYSAATLFSCLDMTLALTYTSQIEKEIIWKKI